MPKGIDHELISSGGTQPQEEILKCAHDLNADLIVMGSCTKEAEKRAYVGSAVEHVSAESTCPVVVVTHPDALAKIR